jgi:thiazole/oxazole-forming peptide maturase SagD family component
LFNDVLEALREAGIAGPLQEAWYYVDEPPYFQYWLDVLIGGEKQRIAGTAFRAESAKKRAIYEAVERHFLGEAPTSLPKLKLADINASFPVMAMPRVQSVELDTSAQFPIVLVRSISDNETLVPAPAQLVFVPYHFASQEPVLRQPISTGAACGQDIDDATLRGVLECIERHDLLTSYELKAVANRVELNDQSADFRWILEELRRCRLELVLIDIGSEWLPTYTFLALVLDRTGIGPSATAGCKTGFGPMITAVGAVEEAMHTRTWLRDTLNTTTKSELDQIRQPGYIPCTFRDRGLLWSHPSMLKHLGFYLDAPSKSLRDYPNRTSDIRVELDEVVHALNKKNLSIFRYDLSNGSPLELLGIKVIKTLIPGLRPLYIDERLAAFSQACIPGRTSLPHFFL